MTKEYLIVISAIVESTLSVDQLERQLVAALWEGMDESVVIPDGQTDALKVVEYIETTVEEFKR